MSKEVFYCPLDQLDSKNNLTGSRNASQQGPDIQLALGQPFEIKFDRFKGSFLSLMEGASLRIGAEAVLSFSKESFTFNFFFNLKARKENKQDLHVLFGAQLDEYLIRYFIKNPTGSTDARIFVECIGIGNDGNPTGTLFVLDTEIEIETDFWYNFNLEISPSGRIDFTVLGTYSILNAGDAEENSPQNNYFFDLSDELNKIHADITVQLAKITSFIFGERAGKLQFDLSDLYIFKGITAPELNQYIEKGLNIASKYTYRTKIGFSIVTRFQDKEYEGIHVIDKSSEHYFLRISVDNYTLVSRGRDSKLVLKFKKGVLKQTEGPSADSGITEEADEIHIVLNLLDGKLEYRLPDLKISNITQAKELFVQCELSKVTVFENNLPIEVCELLSIDRLVPVKDLSGVSSVPFEIVVLGDQEILFAPGVKNSFVVNLINASDQDLMFNRFQALHSGSRFKFRSRFLEQLVLENSWGGIKIDIQKFEQAQKGFEGSKDFAYEYNSATNEIMVAATTKSSLSPGSMLRLVISGIQFKEPSIAFPVGRYPFDIKFENLENYNDGVLPFHLELKRAAAATILDFPVGGIVAFYGEKVPDHWLLCDGKPVDHSLYPDLYRLLGGEKRLPDLRGRFLVGAGSKYSLGDMGGVDELSLNVDQMPQHDHQIKAVKSYESPFKEVNMGWAREESLRGGVYGTDRDNGADKYFVTRSNSPVKSEGGGKAHENRPPYLAVNYIIRAK
ncbi:phage Tail Collar [Pedobacter sp. BAL39]|uniref:phage tail protein n=1 Tax=Pedobacter sp. BAL39 TaxID=391596 RepID=UPI000155926C|nr:tail fiber protein [Pedobacter sp. BAL39]EDM38502.1 phage Tail Collar [Pedobacter sp. BAL39]